MTTIIPLSESPVHISDCIWTLCLICLSMNYIQNTMYDRRPLISLYFVGSSPCNAATFPCLNLFDGFQVAFGLNFKMLTLAYKSLHCWFLSLGLHLPLNLPWLTSLWTFGWSSNFWKKPSSFPPQVLDSCLLFSVLEGSLPFHPSPISYCPSGLSF